MKRPRFPRNVVTLGFVSLLNDASSEMIYPLLPTFVTGVLGGSLLSLGIIEGIAEAANGLFKFLFGRLSDVRGRRKPFVIAGYLVSGLAKLTIALAAGWPMVLASRFADRLGKGVRTAPRDALLAASAPVDSRGTSFGFQRALDNMGAVIGPLLAAAVLWLLLRESGVRPWNISALNLPPEVLAGSLRKLFAIAATPTALAVALCAAFVRDAAGETARKKSEPGRGVRPLFPFLLPLVLFSLGNSSDAFILMRARDVGVPVAALPLLWMVHNTAKTASALPGGWASDRLGRKALLAGGWLVYAAAYAGFAAARAPWQAWGLVAFYGLFFGMTEGAERALVADLVSSRRATGYGIYNLTTAACALPSSLLIAWLWESRGAAVAFGVGAGLALLAAALLPPALSLARRLSEA